jgi:hypothetical protein
MAGREQEIACIARGLGGDLDRARRRRRGQSFGMLAPLIVRNPGRAARLLEFTLGKMAVKVLRLMRQPAFSWTMGVRKLGAGALS